MIKITFEMENLRSVAYDTENNQNVGNCSFKNRGDTWILDHTVVDPKYGGQGIAGKLLEEVVKNAREKNKKIVPVCSYVKKTVEKEPKKYDDILAK